MNHQWDLFPEAPGDVRVRCTACGKDAVVINNMIGRAVAVEDCPAAVEGMLLSTPTLVQIDEDLWVNPAAVDVVFDVPDSSDGLLPHVPVVSFRSGKTYPFKGRTVAEVVALINGSAE